MMDDKFLSVGTRNGASENGASAGGGDIRRITFETILARYRHPEAWSTIPSHVVTLGESLLAIENYTDERNRLQAQLEQAQLDSLYLREQHPWLRLAHKPCPDAMNKMRHEEVMSDYYTHMTIIHKAQVRIAQIDVWLAEHQTRWNENLQIERNQHEWPALQPDL